MTDRVLFRGPDDWRRGDRAFIAGHPTGGKIRHGEIMHVEGVRIDTGEPYRGTAILSKWDRMPCRVIEPGEVIPRGTVVLYIAGHKYGSTKRIASDMTVGDHLRNTWALLGLPAQFALPPLTPERRRADVMRRAAELRAKHRA